MAIPRGAGSELAITVRPQPADGILESFTRLAAALRELDAVVVHLLVYGDTAAAQAGSEAMRRILGEVDWPVTWVEGAACGQGPIAGLQVFAFAGGDVQRIRINGKVVGSVFEDGMFRHCVLGGIAPGRVLAPRDDQARQALERLDCALALGGFGFADVVRTWFFLKDILAWYGEFNRARTQMCRGISFRTGSLPASTGVGAGNACSAALTTAAWAARPLRPDARVMEVASPLQCPAPAYGSSFSRAMEMSYAEGRRLLVSGTASIAPEGHTLWQDDPRRQLEQSMNVVERLLQARGFELSDLTRVTGYFKHRDQARLFDEWRAAQGLPPMPLVLAQCDICREDLLFELEADAWTAAAPPPESRLVSP